MKTCIYQVPGILTFLAVLVLSCSVSENLSERPLYSINKYKYQDNIQGRLFRSQLLIVKDSGPAVNTVVTLEKYASGGKAMYSMDVQFVGPDWPYMDGIILIIDGEIFKLRDEDPIRIPKSGDTVLEGISCFLDEHTYKGLRYCKSLEIHYNHKVKVIPQEGIEAIWNFLRE